VEQAARLATPAVLPVVGFVAFFRLAMGNAVIVGQVSKPTAESCGACSLCGADVLVCGRHSSWSKPPGLPCRRPRRQSNTLPTRPGLPNPFRRPQCSKLPALPQSGYGLSARGLYSPPFTNRSRISLCLTGQARPLSGVKLSCSDSIMGNGSLGPGI